MSTDPIYEPDFAIDDTKNQQAPTARLSPPWPTITTILSTFNAASLISLFVGLCYFYNRSYRTAYFGPFGLDADSVPVAFPDAIADGFFGITANVMTVVAICAGAFLVYVVLIWFAERSLDKIIARLGFPASRPLPHPALLELGRNFGFRTSLIATLVAVGTTVVSIIALFLIAGPAEHAAGRDVTALRARFTSDKAQCVRFGVKGSKDLVGWRIGSTSERQYILGNDDAVHVMKFDELDRLQQNPVRCSDNIAPQPKVQQPQISGRRGSPVAGI